MKTSLAPKRGYASWSLRKCLLHGRKRVDQLLHNAIRIMSVAELPRAGGPVRVGLQRLCSQQLYPVRGVGGADTGAHFARSIFHFFFVVIKHVKRRVLRKLFLKHQQTVDPHARAPQVVRGLFGCPYTNF